MQKHRIICTIQVPMSQPHKHAHIVQVGTGTDAGYSKLWSVSDVYAAMDRGDQFFTYGMQSQKWATVQKFKCAVCRFETLRSGPDAVLDNNLDSLPTCNT
jgi:hypothetical protein